MNELSNRGYSSTQINNFLNINGIRTIRTNEKYSPKLVWTSLNKYRKRLSRFKKDKIFNIKEELYITLKLWFNLNMNSFIFRLSRLISSIVFILILGTTYYYFFSEAKMYGLSRDGIVGLLFICSILIIITIIFNWLCFGKFSIWIKKDKFSDE